MKVDSTIEINRGTDNKINPVDHQMCFSLVSVDRWYCFIWFNISIIWFSLTLLSLRLLLLLFFFLPSSSHLFYILFCILVHLLSWILFQDNWWKEKRSSSFCTHFRLLIDFILLLLTWYSSTTIHSPTNLFLKLIMTLT